MRGDSDAGSTTSVLAVAAPPSLEETAGRLADLGPFSVETATTVTEALESLSRETDCVVTEYELAEGDGLELLDAVRERESDLPVILFTDRGSEQIASEAISTGVTDYLRKDGTGDHTILLANRITNAVDRRERERRYQTLVENLPGIVYRSGIGESWPFQFVDGECESLTGYTASELAEDVDWGTDIIHPEDREHVYDEVMAAVEAEDPFEVTYRIEDRSGQHRWLWERGRAVDDETLEGFITDVTDRVAYERDLERYQTIVEASGDAMYTLDDEGHLMLVNDSFVEMVGYDREELLDEHIEIVMTDEGVERGEEIIRSLLEHGDQRGMFEMDVITAEGEAIPCENHMVLLPHEDEFRGTAGVLRDITERKRREEALERERDRLEQFASVISHDLRNPLTVARGYLDIAEAEADPEAFEMIDRSHDRMERIIEDVLWLAREGLDIGETEPVSLASVAEDAWTHVAADKPDPELAYDGAALGEIEADRDRLTQLLENVFRNAIDHAGPDVTVTIESVADGFAVADDGPGIPPEKREQVFERGFTTSEDGTGLGLHIVEQVATAHEWDIEIETADTGGTRFVFRTSR